MWEDARLIKSSPFTKSFAWAEDTENMGNVNIPKKNAKIYKIFKEGSSNKKILKAGVLNETNERQFYTKKSEKKRLAKAAGRQRWLRKLRETAGRHQYSKNYRKKAGR